MLIKINDKMYLNAEKIEGFYLGACQDSISFIISGEEFPCFLKSGENAEVKMAELAEKINRELAYNGVGKK